MKKSSIARTQFELAPGDLTTILALQRAGSLPGAAARLGVDGSTVFRTVKRVERGLGQRLFTPSRQGYRATELALALAADAEDVERALEAARSRAQARPGVVSGRVRVSTTDTILHGLVAPAVAELRRAHPLLSFELHTGNELVDVRRRDADIVLRATRRPPPHLVGKQLGPIRMALYAPAKAGLRSLEAVRAAQPAWIAPDEALPEHPSVAWRRRQFPRVEPSFKVSSILTVLELIGRGLGVGVVPMFLAAGRRDVVALTGELDDCRTELWLLTHTENRHLLRVATVYSHFARSIVLA